MLRVLYSADESNFHRTRRNNLLVQYDLKVTGITYVLYTDQKRRRTYV